MMVFAERRLSDRDGISWNRDEATEPFDLTVIIVSHNDGQWLERCLKSVVERSAGVNVEMIVADNGSDDAGRIVGEHCPAARVLRIDNHGFAHANNRATLLARGRYILFLNPDTAILEGNFTELVGLLDDCPDVGVAGVRQLTADGALWPTIRYFPSVARALGDSAGGERWRRRPRWAGERELDPVLYERETDCDWTSGSFMCVRREALLSAGLMDERFFLFCEEPDLCRRIKQAGWRVRHLPTMTILHHAGKAGKPPRMTAQAAFTRRQYARKHFGSTYRAAYLAAVASGYLARAIASSPASEPQRRRSARLALRTLAGFSGPPYAAPPASALPAALD